MTELTRTIAIAVAVLMALSAPGTGVAIAQPAQDHLEKLSSAFRDLADRTTPAVVGIMATGYAPSEGGFWSEEGLLTRQQAGGSGVLVSSDGYVITNAHVVEGAQRIQVVLSPEIGASAAGRSIVRPRGRIVGAQVAGIDFETDLAILKIAETGLPFLRLGNSDDVHQGQLVFAFGSPLGLENSVTMGVVSAVARQLRPESPMIYIQTDASINPGNSGGPLVNARGEVIGINTSILSQSGGAEGIGFAAPSNIVRSIFNQIKERGYVRRGEIGVNAQTITPQLTAALDLPTNTGVILSDVYPESPAEEAGLQIGDVVLALDGKAMENGRQLTVNLYGKAEGALVSLVVLRGQDTIRTRVAVVERQDYQSMLFNMVTPERNLIAPLGILALDLTPAMEEYLGQTRYQTGVVVAARSRSSLMWEHTIQPGDIIYFVNNERIESLDQLRTSLTKLASAQVVLHVERRGQLIYVPMETR
jgi:serine protease Do